MKYFLAIIRIPIKRLYSFFKSNWENRNDLTDKKYWGLNRSTIINLNKTDAVEVYLKDKIHKNLLVVEPGLSSSAAVN